MLYRPKTTVVSVNFLGNRAVQVFDRDDFAAKLFSPLKFARLFERTAALNKHKVRIPIELLNFFDYG